MKKIKSQHIFDDPDLPMSLVRLAILKGTGVDVEELRQKPMIAVVNSHTELNPGHAHLKSLAERVKEGIYAGGGIPFEFNVPAPCDGLANGNEGMRFILPQRELIADMVETYVRSQLFDGLVLISSCDKINPGMIMAAARLDLPTIFLPGGPGAWQIRFTPGRGESVDHKDYTDLPLKLATATLAT
ncbi:MAG: dihydroxy-acid dehydratase, partial [Deltaproteobacteria bacterium]